ncbi:MAG TPA: pyridoxamine 5'-phosphate oxidase family protein [Polyangiaceae bacterium]|nr:pyridoxamine 5'-phosphate oxidase family protein [Polyangiaceae bacterium]
MEQQRATFPVTSRTQVKRRPDRASYDRAVAHAILDEALVASVGFVDQGVPFVIPMAFARQDERLILHGASKSRLQTSLASGAPICVTVTLLDGVVLARSAMHHSMNYRSVLVLGEPHEIEDTAQKLEALDRLVEHVLPGRSLATRPPNELELKATRVFWLPLEEVSIKVRSGGPIDDAEDLPLQHWAGVIPLALRAAEPVPDPRHSPHAAVPPAALAYDRAVRPVSTAGAR